ncbi:MAG: glycosyltransferase 87 family protein [Planctomycetota bacterium]
MALCARGALDLLLSPPLLRLVTTAGLIGWAVAFLVFVIRIPGPVGPDGQHLGGDFLNFYTAGRMVLAGDGERLYDLGAQLAAQRAAAGGADWNGLAAYINPPVLALACAPLAALPYKLAYVLATLALLAVFLAGLRALRPCLPNLIGHWDLVVALSLLFYPYTRSITGGQNTAVSFALMAALFAALQRSAAGRRSADLWAGIWLGLLFYKPQLALLFCLLLALRGRFRVVAYAAGGALAHYAVGALVSGPLWPLHMSAALRAYWPLEFEHNGAHLVSWLGFCEYALPRAVFKPVGLALMVATLAALLWAWRRARVGQDDFGLYWGLAVCATILISPHTQWYDAGLVLLPVLLALEHLAARDVHPGLRVHLALAAGFLLFPLYLAAPWLGFQPLTFMPLAGFLWLCQIIDAPATPAGSVLRVRRSAEPSCPTGSAP